MWRFIKRILLAVVVIGAAFAGFIAVDQGMVPPRGEVRLGAIAAAIGLVLGLGVAKWRRIDWVRLSAMLRAWRSSVIDTVSWLALACASIIVLFLY